jgi:hypothetical protein
MLADRWGAETPPVATSQFSVEYWRQKASEFQSTINAVDEIARESIRLLDILPDGPERDAIADGLDEFNTRRSSMKFAAEGINMGAAVINASGGRFPVLSVPATLGLPPIALPAAAIAAFTAAASLIAWAIAWNRTQVARINSATLALDAIEDPAERARVAAQVAVIRANAEAAAAQSESPFASLATVAKWGGIAVLAFLAYRAWEKSRG